MLSGSASTTELTSEEFRAWSWRDTLKVLGLFLAPSKSHARTLYEVLSTYNNLAETSLYLNLGYWESAQTYDSACEAMAQILGKEADLRAEDEVLDVGFGFGDQDIYWQKKFCPKKIVGINITPLQVEVARRRVAEHRLDDRIEFHVGSAISLPFEAVCFDTVLALETAFHFPSREEFFHEAYRVLRPGGRIALADIVPLTQRRFGLIDRITDYMGRSLWQIPSINAVSITVYVEMLRKAGFQDIQVRSIRDQVYRPFSEYARRRLNNVEIVKRMNPLIRIFWKASVKDDQSYSGLDYIIVTAQKPESEGDKVNNHV
jgi:ubiquinone/menaquinone biosynthesis C-methylase UbiE